MTVTSREHGARRNHVRLREKVVHHPCPVPLRVFRRAETKPRKPYYEQFVAKPIPETEPWTRAAEKVDPASRTHWREAGQFRRDEAYKKHFIYGMEDGMNAFAELPIFCSASEPSGGRNLQSMMLRIFMHF